MAYVAADYNAKVQAYFVTTLGRPATSPELAQFSQGLVDNAGSVWTSGLVTYLTTQTGFPSGTNYGQIVTDMYTNLTGAAPALTAYNFYVGQLSVGSIKLKGLANAILNDNGYMPKADGTYGSPSGWVTSAATVGSNAADLATLQLKVGAAATFTAALDTAAENTDIATTSGYTAAKNWLTAVVDTASAAAATTASANTAIAAVSGAGSVGQTFTLTAGVDNGTAFTGGSGNDTYNANPALNVANGLYEIETLTGLDVLDGGAGTDTLNMVALGAWTAPTSVTISNIESATVLGDNNVTLNASGWTGLTSLSLTGAAAATLTAATTTAVTVSGTTGAVTVDGGSTVNVTATASTIELGATTGAAGAITVTHSAQAANNIKIDGGTSVSLTTSAATTGTVNVGGNGIKPTGAVTVTSSGNYTDNADVTLGAIDVTGGTTVTVTQTSGITAAETTAALTDTDDTNKTVTQSAVTVTGGSATTTVTVTQDKTVAVSTSDTAGVIGVTAGQIVVNDVSAASGTAAGTIAAVTLNNFGGTSAIDSSALTSVSLSGTGTALNISRGALTATPTANTLTLNVSGLTTTGAVTDAEAGAGDDGFTTLNIVTSGSASTIASLVGADLTTLAVSGSAALTLTAYTAAALTSVTAGDGGLTMGTTTLATGASFTSGAGADSVIIGATTKAISTGAGDDTVTLANGTTAITGTAAGGDGTDTLSFATTANAATATGNATFEGQISGFERVKLAAYADAAGVTVDLSNLDDINYVTLAGATASSGGARAQAISGFTTGGTFIQTALLGTDQNLTLSGSGFAAGTADTFNITLDGSNGYANVGSLTLANVESIAITTNDNDTTAATTAFDPNIDITSVKTLTIGGDAGVTFANSDLGTALTSLDASGLTATGAGGALTYTTAALAGASTITGGAGNDTVTATLAVGAVTLSGNGGNDTLAGGGAADTVSGGDGDDTISGGAGSDTLTGGAGGDIFTVLTATDSNGVAADTISDFVTGTDKVGLLLGAGNEVVTYVGEASSYGTVLTSLSGVKNQAVLDTSTKTLYVDVNGSGTLTAADVAINLTISDLSQSDFATYGTTGANTFAMSVGVDTIYGLGGGDTYTMALNTATLAAVATDGLSISTVGMDVIKQAIATDAINVTAQVGTDANYDSLNEVAAGGTITKTVSGTELNQFVGLYDYATNTFTSTASAATTTASTTDVAALLYLYATADGTTANQGLVVIGVAAQGDAAIDNGVLTLA